MSVHKVPSWNLPRPSCRKWHIYAIFLEPDPGDFLVKIGAATDPLNRVNKLRQGLPFKPTILWAPANGRRTAFKIERSLHKTFEGRNTFGEWFRFSMEDKQVFHEATKFEFSAATGKELEWSVVSCDQWLEYVALLAKENEERKTRKFISPSA